MLVKMLDTYIRTYIRGLLSRSMWGSLRLAPIIYECMSIEFQCSIITHVGHVTPMLTGVEVDCKTAGMRANK